MNRRTVTGCSRGKFVSLKEMEFGIPVAITESDQRPSGSPEEFHPQAPTELDVNLSIHPAGIVGRSGS